MHLGAEQLHHQFNGLEELVGGVVRANGGEGLVVWIKAFPQALQVIAHPFQGRGLRYHRVQHNGAVHFSRRP